MKSDNSKHHVSPSTSATGSSTTPAKTSPEEPVLSSVEAAPLDFAKVLQVQIREAAPNPVFTEWQRDITRFLHFSRAVPCAECGRRSKHHWTQLMSFKAHSLDGSSFLLENTGSGRVYPPMTPVCGKHPLAVAELPEIPKPAKAKRAALAKARGGEQDAG